MGKNQFHRLLENKMRYQMKIKSIHRSKYESIKIMI